MKFSVVVCTWNRSAMLADTLDSILACREAYDGDVEILVVDNASTDNTASLVSERYVQVGVQYVLELNAGLSHARNAGIRHASGDWILFLDDDVLLPTEFLAAYSLAIATLPDVGFWGGPVRPRFEGTVPWWTDAVLAQLPWCFSALDLGAETKHLGPLQTPFGANMCIRGSLARQIQFSTELGFSHGSFIAGEETEYFHRAREHGAKGGWAGACGLIHRLPVHRASWSGLTSRCKGQGRTEAILMHNAGSSTMWGYRELLGRIGKLPFVAVLRPSSMPAELLHIHVRIGFAAEDLKIRLLGRTDRSIGA